jgi:HeH/LEM domain
MGHYVNMEAALSRDDYAYLTDRGMKFQADQVVANYGWADDDELIADENTPYDQWNIPGLKDELTNRGIEFESKARKADLIALLEEDDATAPSDPNADAE